MVLLSYENFCNYILNESTKLQLRNCCHLMAEFGGIAFLMRQAQKSGVVFTSDNCALK